MRRSVILAVSGAVAVVAAAAIVGVMAASPPTASPPTALSLNAHPTLSPGTHPARSPVTHTTLSVKQWKTTITGGQQATISGQLMTGSTPLTGKVVYLYQVTNGKLHQVGRAQLTSQTGKPWFTVQPTTTTTYELVFHGTQTLAPSHSGDVTLTVG